MENHTLTRGATGLDIDPRSFHVFEFEGRRLLFDRATGTTLELNEVAFDSLRLIEQSGVQEAMTTIELLHPGVAADDIREALSAMKANGMFRFEPLDLTQQDNYLQTLWRHHPRRIQMLMAQGCNLGCRYCYAWRNGSNQNHTLMPWNIARQAVDYLVCAPAPGRSC